MTDDQSPISDDDRADLVWRRAAAKATVRHIAPDFLPAVAGGVLFITTLPFAVIGAARLGVWALLVAVYGVVLLVLSARVIAKARRLATDRRAQPLGEQVERLRSDYQRYERTSRWKPLRTWTFWRQVLGFSVPKAALAAYGLLLWLPLPAAVAVAGLPVAWAFGSRVVQHRRTGQAIAMMTTPRIGGLPTPEV